MTWSPRPEPARESPPPGSWWLAIDFGTSFTTAAIAHHDHTEVLEIDNSRYLPSVVFLERGGDLLVGREALSESLIEPARAERVPKRAMVVAEHARLGGRDVETVTLVAALLHRVTREARRRHGDHPPERVVLTHPARWQPGGTELTRLAAAAAEAGLSEPELVAEPVAAAHYYARRAGSAAGETVAVYDFGGGTFDAAVLLRETAGFVLAGPPGGDTSVGGEDLDAELMDLLGTTPKR